MLSLRTWSLIAIVLATAAMRVVPHSWNFTPVGAVCLFGGAYFARSWAAVAVPLLALLASDLYLAVAVYGFTGFQVIWMNYALFALTALLGRTLHGKVTFGRVVVTAVLASAMFFVLSNFQAWLTGYEGYPYTAAGLWTCYVAALPFAQSMLAGNLLYCGILFGGWEFLQICLPKLRHEGVLAPVPVRS